MQRLTEWRITSTTRSRKNMEYILTYNKSREIEVATGILDPTQYDSWKNWKIKNTWNAQIMERIALTQDV